MTKPYTQITEENMKLALAHFKATGEILDVLLVCYDQHGKWKSHPFLEDGDCANLLAQTIPADRLVKITPNGHNVLLCSLSDLSEMPIAIDYHYVAGNLIGNSTPQFSAINLETVGGFLDVALADTVNVPNLKDVGFDFDAGYVTDFSAEKLQTVGGCLTLNCIKEFNAPNLQTVGRYLHAPHAIAFDAPKLEAVYGSLLALEAITFNTPSLHTVCIYLNASSATTFVAQNLHTVNGDLKADSATTFDAPELQTVKGYLNAESATTFNAPKLVTVGEKLILPSATWQAIMANCPVARRKAAEAL